MGVRNGPGGYGWASKGLHWTTVLAVAGQFALGLSIDFDDSGKGGEDGRRDDDAGPLLGDPDALLTAHVTLGVTILLLAVARVAWRRFAGLPPWSDHLSAADRRLAHWTERTLLAMLFVVPATGLVLYASGDDDVLPLHIAAHVAILLALAAHLVTNLRPRILRRML